MLATSSALARALLGKACSSCLYATAATQVATKLPASLQGIPAQPDQPIYSPEPSHTYVAEALQHTHVDPGIIKSIIHPDREVTVQLPVAMDTGEVELLSAHMIHHNNSRGIYKGGLVFHPDVSLEGLRTLATINTWKTALMDVPFGGAKLGVAVDPRKLSLREQEKIIRKMVSALQSLIGPTVCIPAPDIGTDERHMSWVFDQYSRIRGFAPAVVSGKPVWLHGCEGRESAPGRGAALMAREFLRKVLRKRVAGSTFIVQGFGKTGSWVSELLAEQGGKIIAVASSETAVYNEAGLDIKALRAHVAQGHYLAEFPGGTAVDNGDTFLEIPCDVVIPAAISSTINDKTAPKLNCQAVVEAANAGISPEGNQILAQRGIAVCPDVLVLGGGVVVSFFEWVQNMNNLHWDIDEVTRKQESYMIAAFNSVQHLARDKGLPLRTAAYCLALERIAQSDTNRGHG